MKIVRSEAEKREERYRRNARENVARARGKTVKAHGACSIRSPQRYRSLECSISFMPRVPSTLLALADSISRHFETGRLMRLRFLISSI